MTVHTTPFYVGKLAIILLVVICILLSLVNCTGQSSRRSPSPKQQFFPNGRYGRRSTMPSLQESASGREMTVAFFGDGSVRCVYAGYGDYYRCNR
ncbi:hypothetical protein CHUAL_011702 [Chamberlinius hualienensis]